jgi:hypothetical protein
MFLSNTKLFQPYQQVAAAPNKTSCFFFSFLMPHNKTRTREKHYEAWKIQKQHER